ncbi:MAG: Ni/Fe hydrogenase subunit alpha [Desulfobulbus sp.]|jgi:F420-non-reducing hydrogenase large subunit|nr:Ni/Fe hydrogenase subunit alpha [Desulfobulbus sp.]
MAQVVTINAVTRIEGHARIRIRLDDSGTVDDARVEITALRGFEQFVVGRPAEEIPRIVSRICGICPWMHHLAAARAIDGCFGVEPPRAGRLLRELCLVLAHIPDKILHFFFLAAPDFVLGADCDYRVRNVIGLARQEPELAARVARMRRLGQDMLARLGGKAVHPVAGVVGGFSRPLGRDERRELLVDAARLLDFGLFALDFARERVLDQCAAADQPGQVTTGFLGTVDEQGCLRLASGRLRLMRPDGTVREFAAEDYGHHLRELSEPWSLAKTVYAESWGEGFSLDPIAPRGVYRVNTLARLNVCDCIGTPRAQAELQEFRARFGRPAQATLLHHWARLIELVYASERVAELLADDRILDRDVRTPAVPRAGRGVGHVEAPRGTLIHDYETDGRGCITRANLIVGTTHNVAAMNLSVRDAASRLICHGACDETILNRIEMALRAYDP